MNIPTFTRAIEVRIQQPETFANNTGDVDRNISDKVTLVEERRKDQFGSQGGWMNKPILECKSIQDLKFISDAKGYRLWSKQFKNALEQARPKSKVRKPMRHVQSVSLARTGKAPMSSGKQ